MKTNKYLIIVFALSMLFLFPEFLSAKVMVTDNDEHPQRYGIEIGGVEITSENYQDISAANGFSAIVGGEVFFDPQTKILTLVNANISSQADHAIHIFSYNDTSRGYKIALKGENSVFSERKNALFATIDVEIFGDGIAYFASEADAAIFTDGSEGMQLKISDLATIYAKGKKGIYSSDEKEDFIVTNATVHAIGTQGSLFNFRKIGLVNCHLALPANGYIEGGSVMTRGAVCTLEVVIEPDISTGISPVKSNPDKSVYSIDGTKKDKDFNSLPSGVYVIGGKKIVK